MNPTGLRAFAAVAKRLSFSQAARELGVSHPQVSKMVSQLEESLQKSLLVRSTRSVRLSPDGERFLPFALRALDSLQEAQDLFQKQGGALSGKIRVTAPQTLTQRLLSSRLAKFHALHPRVEIEFLLSDSYLDLVENDIDLAFRVMNLGDSSLIATKLTDNPLIFCASPRYLKSAPRIKSVDDLSNHQVMAISAHMELRFEKSGRKLRDHIPSPWLMASNGDLLVEQAKLHGGVLVRSRWGVEPELASGELVELKINDRFVAKSAVYLVFPEQRFMPQRTRAFIDFMKASF